MTDRFSGKRKKRLVFSDKFYIIITQHAQIKSTFESFMK